MYGVISDHPPPNSSKAQFNSTGRQPRYLLLSINKKFVGVRKWLCNHWIICKMINKLIVDPSIPGMAGRGTLVAVCCIVVGDSPHIVVVGGHHRILSRRQTTTISFQEGMITSPLPEG